MISQGDAGGNFVAFDAFNGDQLWSKNLNTGIIALPMTYMIDGEQYITIPVGWGGLTEMEINTPNKSIQERFILLKLTDRQSTLNLKRR